MEVTASAIIRDLDSHNLSVLVKNEGIRSVDVSVQWYIELNSLQRCISVTFYVAVNDILKTLELIVILRLIHINTDVTECAVAVRAKWCEISFTLQRVL